MPQKGRGQEVFLKKTDSFGQPELFLFGNGERGRRRGVSKKKTIGREPSEPDGIKKQWSEKEWSTHKVFEQEGFRSAAGILFFDLMKPAAQEYSGVLPA